MRDIILKLTFAVWVVLWVSFTAREIFLKGAFRDYKILLSRTLDGKRAYVTGDKFYEFLSFCGRKMPEGAAYSLAGMERGPGKENIDPSFLQRKAAYYLYPRLPKEDAEYILVYEEKGVNRDGYYKHAAFDDNSFILKRQAR
jgi:hypothetical protein